MAFLVASKFATGLYDNYLANPALFLVIAATVVFLGTTLPEAFVFSPPVSVPSACS